MEHRPGAHSHDQPRVQTLNHKQDKIPEGEKKHAFHLGDARAGEDKHEPMFLAFHDKLTWRSGTICDNAPAENRAKWLMENKGMAEEEAHAFVMGEFPHCFGPSAPASGHFVDGKFPHTLELVKDATGKSRIKFSVTPPNAGDVSMVAVHYSVNGEPGKEDMNFDINKPQEGTQTYVHVTPDFGPVCEPGAKVTYWLAAMEKGLIKEMPEKACPIKETSGALDPNYQRSSCACQKAYLFPPARQENRMTWTAQ